MITADSYSSLGNREPNLQAVIQMQVAYQKGVEQIEVFEAVRTVLSVRNYKETPIPPDLVRRIVEAGRLSGSAVNGQPWHFIAIEGRETLHRLG